jgi:hypothetical protein
VNDTRRDNARRQALAVLNKIRDNIETNATTVNKTQAAEAAGVAPSSFYRWLANPPAKIDVTAIAALADWLHDEYGHSDFAALWREAGRELENRSEVVETETHTDNTVNGFEGLSFAAQ